MLPSRLFPTGNLSWFSWGKPAAPESSYPVCWTFLIVDGTLLGQCWMVFLSLLCVCVCKQITVLRLICATENNHCSLSLMPQLSDFIVGMGPDWKKLNVSWTRQTLMSLIGKKTEFFLDTTDHNKACSKRFSIPLLAFRPAHFSDSSTGICILALECNAVFCLGLVDGVFCISVELFLLLSENVSLLQASM